MVDESAPKEYRILALDGGGIRGVFPASFLSAIQPMVKEPIASYFDLIAGTSTGGIIALGLGLGIPINDMLALYETKGPKIFDQAGGPVRNWVVQWIRFFKQLTGHKYENIELRDALHCVLKDRKIGESTTRLLIPSWDAVNERVYVYKTAHHPRLRTDYNHPAMDAAMGTSAPPTILPPHVNVSEVTLIDGGVWANNPIGLAVVEGIGVLNWPRDRIKILSIGTINEVVKPSRFGGVIPLFVKQLITRLFMLGQHHSAMGTAMLLTGHPHTRKAIWRIDQTAPAGRYSLDRTKYISEMKGRGFSEARTQSPELLREFFYAPAEPFVPVYKVGENP